MTHLIVDPHTFVDDVIAGFAAAHQDRIRAVPGGVVRSARTHGSTVALVTGGGSGHYPAFAGLVGTGLAHGAAMGDVFASPSHARIVNVAREAATGRGVLFVYGNYAGDVLNFDDAQQTLRSEGIECLTVTVTDDIASAPRERRHERRGVAGDLAVLKVAGACADEGASLDEVAEVAARTNAALSTIGVAFGGCTLPGADAPLFSVPHGQMGVGMGIHGEPGLHHAPLPSLRELADDLVSRLLDDAPQVAGGQRRAIPVLNGLGTVKYEELYALYGHVAHALDAAGVEAIDPHVGEFCTSLDMPGLSLSLLWPDDAIERWWLSPADAPGYRAPGRTAAQARRRVDTSDLPGTNSHVGAPGALATPEGDALLQLMRVARDAIVAQADELGRLDSIAGDGDHGRGMSAGIVAAVAAAEHALSRGSATPDALDAAGEAWSERAGGTSGMLWGLMLRTASATWREGSQQDATTAARAVAAARQAVIARGGASVGDKTLVDALEPFASALEAAARDGATLTEAWRHAADRATSAAAATARLEARTGRARNHGDHSVGHPDPGATSFALIVSAVADAATDTTHSTEEERP